MTMRQSGDVGRLPSPGGYLVEHVLGTFGTGLPDSFKSIHGEFSLATKEGREAHRCAITCVEPEGTNGSQRIELLDESLCGGAICVSRFGGLRACGIARQTWIWSVGGGGSSLFWGALGAVFGDLILLKGIRASIGVCGAAGGLFSTVGFGGSIRWRLYSAKERVNIGVRSILRGVIGSGCS